MIIVGCVSIYVVDFVSELTLAQLFCEFCGAAYDVNMFGAIVMLNEEIWSVTERLILVKQ